MKTYIWSFLALLVVGCKKEHTVQANDDKYRITMCFEKRADHVWTTPYSPVADHYGFIIIMADRSIVRISGPIIIEQIK